MKRGKEIYALRFTIKSSSKAISSPKPNTNTNTNEDLVKRLVGLGMSIDSASNLIGKWDEARLVGNLEIVEQRINGEEKTGKSIGSYVAYLNKALAADWRPVEAEIDIKRRLKKEAKEVAERAAKEKQEADNEVESRKIKTRVAAAEEAYDKMTNEEKLKAVAAFLKVLQAGNDPALSAAVSKTGLSTKRAKITFLNWLNNEN